MTPKETITARLDTFRMQDRTRYDYVLERAKFPQPSVKDACKHIGKTRNWYYDQPEEVRQDMERLASDLFHDSVTRARMVLQDAAPRAAGMVLELIDDRDAKVRLAAAQDILNRTVGKAPEQTESKISGTVLIWNIKSRAKPPEPS
jgi:hypothetical protein